MLQMIGRIKPQQGRLYFEQILIDDKESFPLPSYNDFTEPDYLKLNLKSFLVDTSSMHKYKMASKGLLNDQSCTGPLYPTVYWLLGELFAIDPTIIATYSFLDASTEIDKIPFDMTLVPKPIQEAMQGQPIGTMKGPIKTTLGYHVTKLISISPPMTRPFEQVRAKLVEELKVIKEEDQFYEYSVLFDDLIVNGASLEEIAKEVPLIITPIAGIQLLSQPSDISPFDTAKELFTEEQEGDKTEIIKETFALQNEGETSPLLELPSGRYIAIALDKITEKSSKPFDQVKDEIKATYIADQQAAQNTENVNAMIKQIQSGDIDFTSLAAEHKDKLQRIEDIGLRSIIAPPLTEAIRPSIFQAKLNTPYMVNLDDQNAKAIINVISFDIPEITENQKDQLATISVKVDQELKDEVFGQYIMSLYNKYDIEINDGLLRAVFGQRDTQEP